MRNSGKYSISSKEYHGDKSYVSRSMLIDFERCPRLFWAKHMNPNPEIQEPTPSMILGSAFHKMILEPNSFEDEFVVLPTQMLLKEVGREKYDLYKLELAKCEISPKIKVTDSLQYDLMHMYKVFKDNEKAMQLLNGCQIENSLFWKDEYSGLLLKCRPDAYFDNLVIDIKTSHDASPKTYQREMLNYGYDIQMAMIRDAFLELENREIKSFINIVIETKYPYNIGIYFLDDLVIEHGQHRYKQLCLDLKKATDERYFPDYGVQTIYLPKWANY